MSETYYPLLAMVLILLASLLSVRFAVSVAIIETAVGVQTSPTAGVRRRRVTHKGGSVFKKILVANNGSDCARRTLETAVELAGFYGADLCMISVEEHLPHYAATVGQVLEEQAEEDSYFAGVVKDAKEVAAAHGEAAHAGRVRHQPHAHLPLFGHGDQVSDGCIFCEIVAGRAPAHVVYEDDRCLAFLDANPYTEGHCLVIPKRHEPWWDDLLEEETVALFHACHVVATRLREVYHPDFVFMYARGRRIPHTHVFLIPTYGGDILDRFFGALEVFQESPPQLAALRAPEAMNRAASRLRGK